MNAVVSQERFSPLVLARICGGIGLFGVAAGFFDIGYVHSHIVVSGDAAATSRNLLTYRTMFDSGIALHLLMVLLNVVAEVASFYIFRRVNPVIATMVLCCALVGASAESLDMLGSVLPLEIAASHAVGAFSAAQKGCDVVPVAAVAGDGVADLVPVLGPDEVLTGYLIFRSGFLPRILGVLLGISGFLYLSDPLLTFGAPALGGLVFPAGLALCLPGELLTALWMATVGLNVAKWQGWREPSGATRPA